MPRKRASLQVCAPCASLLEAREKENERDRKTCLGSCRSRRPWCTWRSGGCAAGSGETLCLNAPAPTNPPPSEAAHTSLILSVLRSQYAHTSPANALLSESPSLSKHLEVRGDSESEKRERPGDETRSCAQRLLASETERTQCGGYLKRATSIMST